MHIYIYIYEHDLKCRGARAPVRGGRNRGHGAGVGGPKLYYYDHYYY